MFVTRIRPRVSETDGVGHINNTTVPIWFEAGREEIFRLFMPELSFKDWNLVIVHMSIDYVKETFYGSDVEVHTWIRRIGNTSFDIGEALYQDGVLRARGMCTYVYYSLKERRPQPIPPDIRDQLAQHLQVEPDGFA
ncbi:acyl-CoA thioesterase [Alicyclobacillus macrosporangiidus]|uniref:acyl-CoA thioesterase n=1 Tax=Alicyclobacillus macrosporangiidus TaxID=392015 RepID=UPI000496D543|nr:thioesterase family protein [Alicyclobacillus macrosporangiidus]MCL6599919.1 acyl-CoA thioesterase [Alicyclobacillus macrosporangiidus]